MDSPENNKETSKSSLSLPGAIIVAGVIIALAVVYVNQIPTEGEEPGVALPDETPKPARVIEDISADDDPALGDPNAPVTIVEFSDYECQFCKRFRDETFDQIKTNYIDTGKARLIYRDFPLTNLHSRATKAAEAANCAGDQGKYWEMHDAIFANQSAIGINDLKQYAVELGLDRGQFDACLDEGKYTEEVRNDYDDGLSYGVTGTPAFFVNGELVTGAIPYSVFVEVIERKLGEVENSK